MGVQSLFPMEAIGRGYELFERSPVRRCHRGRIRAAASPCTGALTLRQRHCPASCFIAIRSSSLTTRP